MNALPNVDKTSIGLAAGGGITYAASGFLPSNLQTAAKIFGLGLLVYGIYRLVMDVTNGPEVTMGPTPTVPGGQKFRIQGEIVVPANQGKIDRQSSWLTAGLVATYPVKLRVTNNGDGAIAPQVRYTATEYGSGDPKASVRTYDVKPLAPGESYDVNEPSFPIASFLETGVQVSARLEVYSTDGWKTLDAITYSL